MTIFRTNTTVGLRIEPDNAGNIVFIANNSSVMRLEPSGIVDLSPARLVVPIGNTATRSNIQGTFRFNNQSNVFEVYNGTSWANVSPAYVSPPLPAPTFVEYLIVGGGGGGGPGAGGYQGGGGGAGGVLLGNSNITAGVFYTFTIGAGGTAGLSGSNSLAFTSVISIGGGGGGPYASPNKNGLSGGSGGGGGAGGPGNPSGSGAAGTPGQGNSGGAGSPYTGDPGIQAGGGGGASQAGTTGSPTTLGKGGDGTPSLITGANVIYGGGGGGGTFIFPGPAGGAGGAGGGGSGGKYGAPGTGISGTVNLGGGAGGGDVGGSGGSGVVILAHSNTSANAIVAAGLTYTLNTTSRPGFLVYTFTAGTLCFFRWK